MRAVILVENDVQDEEFIYPKYRLEEAGCEVLVFVPNKDVPVYGKHGIKIVGTNSFSELHRFDRYVDVVIIPGGWGCPEKLRMNDLVLNFLRVASRTAIIGAICHGPWVLISADLVRDKSMTCYRGMKDDLQNAGAIYTDDAVVVHGNFITSPHYRNNPQFMAAIINALEKRKV